MSETVIQSDVENVAETVIQSEDDDVIKSLSDKLIYLAEQKFDAFQDKANNENIIMRLFERIKAEIKEFINEYESNRSGLDFAIRIEIQEDFSLLCEVLEKMQEPDFVKEYGNYTINMFVRFNSKYIELKEQYQSGSLKYDEIIDVLDPPKNMSEIYDLIGCGHSAFVSVIYLSPIPT